VVALDAGFEQGRHCDDAASEDLAALVVLHGAMALSTGGGFQQEADCWSGLDVQALRKGGQRRQCAVKEKKEPSLLSFKGGREGVVSQTSPLMRRFKTPVTLYTAHDLHAALSHRLRSRHASAASTSSHGPLTTRIDACRWRAQQLLGAPDPSLPREGAFTGQAPGGYCRCSRYRAIPVHLLLGPFNGPASAQG
jgi:hypothetical protein